MVRPPLLCWGPPKTLCPSRALTDTWDPPQTPQSPKIPADTWVFPEAPKTPASPPPLAPLTFGPPLDLPDPLPKCLASCPCPPRPCWTSPPKKLGPALPFPQHPDPPISPPPLWVPTQHPQSPLCAPPVPPGLSPPLLLVLAGAALRELRALVGERRQRRRFGGAWGALCQRVPHRLLPLVY